MELNATAHKLLDVAEEKTQIYGFNAFSYKDLQKIVGIKTSSIHYYFPTKQDLALALVTRFIDRFRQQLTEITEKNKKGLKRLEALAQIYTSALPKNQLSLSGMLSSDLASLSEQVCEELQEFFMILEMWVVQAIHLAQEQHEVSPSVNPHKAAALWVGLLEGGALIARVSGSAEFLDKSMHQALEQLKHSV